MITSTIHLQDENASGPLGVCGAGISGRAEVQVTHRLSQVTCSDCVLHEVSNQKRIIRQLTEERDILEAFHADVLQLVSDAGAGGRTDAQVIAWLTRKVR